MIDGVKVKKLKIIRDGRGFLMEILRSDDEIFQKFGQVYLTYCKYGVAKAWHWHKIQDDYVVCVWGKALFVLFDPRKDSPTKGEVNKFVLSDPSEEAGHLLVKIPRGVIHGFTALAADEARLINTPTEKYNYKNPDEYRLPWNSDAVPYRWPEDVKSGG